VFGPDHPQVAHIRVSLAALHRRAGALDLARSEYTRALEVFRSLRSDDPRVSLVLNNLARIDAEEDKPDAALEKLQESLAIMASNGDPDHVQTGPARSLMCQVLRSSGKLTAAEFQCREALRVLDAAYDGPHVDVASAKMELSRVLLQRGETSSAHRMADDAVADLERCVNESGDPAAREKLVGWQRDQRAR
jgi:serine/threonine-protein kinase